MTKAIKQQAKQARQAVQVEGGTVCQLANFLFPQGRVVSGHSAALKHVAEQAMARGALKAQMLTVSGAFHTRLMQPARDALSKPFPAHDPAAMRELLARQLVEPVQWEGTLKALIEAGKQAAGGAGPARLTELGPGQQIKAMVRRLDGDAWKAFTNIAA
ncbi:malonyl-acyl carrier transacylase [Haematococcus lacustris]|uniref:Malonyl-acyl carrier transacylase n=1 Tax=Haematococcus lacustris TaxID=44745 RepID=A0A699YUE4_HAELA|nr:malonyl-acyl carrier transacylase [Haematococcus lacustris]